MKRLGSKVKFYSNRHCRIAQVAVLIFFLIIDSHTSVAQDTSLYPSLNSGIKAPEIKGTNEHGKSLKLSKIKSRYILLYFYEVNCHLCESVTPEIKKLYDSYHQLGLEVVAVPIESDRKEWNEYISQHNLSWKNLFPDPDKTGPLKTNYLLAVSPTFYLLDRKQMLLTKRLGRLDQVEEELNRRIR